MEREKIERETKREKKNFAWEERKKEERAKFCHLQEDSQGGEGKVLPPSRR